MGNNKNQNNLLKLLEKHGWTKETDQIIRKNINEKKLDVNQYINSLPLLHHAIIYSFHTSKVDAIEFLLQNKVNINASSNNQLKKSALEVLVDIQSLNQKKYNNYQLQSLINNLKNLLTDSIIIEFEDISSSMDKIINKINNKNPNNHYNEFGLLIDHLMSVKQNINTLLKEQISIIEKFTTETMKNNSYNDSTKEKFEPFIIKIETLNEEFIKKTYEQISQTRTLITESIKNLSVFIPNIEFKKNILLTNTENEITDIEAIINELTQNITKHQNRINDVFDRLAYNAYPNTGHLENEQLFQEISNLLIKNGADHHIASDQSLTIFHYLNYIKESALFERMLLNFQLYKQIDKKDIINSQDKNLNSLVASTSFDFWQEAQNKIIEPFTTYIKLKLNPHHPTEESFQITEKLQQYLRYQTLIKLHSDHMINEQYNLLHPYEKEYIESCEDKTLRGTYNAELRDNLTNDQTKKLMLTELYDELSNIICEKDDNPEALLYREQIKSGNLPTDLIKNLYLQLIPTTLGIIYDILKIVEPDMAKLEEELKDYFLSSITANQKLEISSLIYRETINNLSSMQISRLLAEEIHNKTIIINEAVNINLLDRENQIKLLSNSAEKILHKKAILYNKDNPDSFFDNNLRKLNTIDLIEIFNKTALEIVQSPEITYNPNIENILSHNQASQETELAINTQTTSQSSEKMLVDSDEESTFSAKTIITPHNAGNNNDHIGYINLSSDEEEAHNQLIEKNHNSEKMIVDYDEASIFSDDTIITPHNEGNNNDDIGYINLSSDEEEAHNQLIEKNHNSEKMLVDSDEESTFSAKTIITPHNEGNNNDDIGYINLSSDEEEAHNQLIEKNHRLQNFTENSSLATQATNKKVSHDDIKTSYKEVSNTQEPTNSPQASLSSTRQEKLRAKNTPHSK